MSVQMGRTRPVSSPNRPNCPSDPHQSKPLWHSVRDEGPSSPMSDQNVTRSAISQPKEEVKIGDFWSGQGTFSVRTRDSQ